MSEIWRRRSLRPLLLFFFFSLQFLSALSDGSLNSELGNQAKTHGNSHSKTGAKVLIVLLAVVAVGLFSFFLFKLWQRKKREEQYARLLKLFEEDDELEVELGLRD
ncbi:uncharacterized protein LOC116123050 [Pistacia vera]|uniref:uncharacterized protein LOC116123050 n=1 Tax=Pistacia vera TaxID=55513 RepID=UPI00126355FA|nr:uncharacterized protein LOC116123050 [Pistacia vera]